jgi:hypothetical protein
MKTVFATSHNNNNITINTAPNKTISDLSADSEAAVLTLPVLTEFGILTTHKLLSLIHIGIPFRGSVHGRVFEVFTVN